MDKKTGSKNLNPLPIIGKSNKKGKKTAQKDFQAQLGHLIDEEHLEQLNESSSSQPKLNKLRKAKNVEKQQQRLIKERQIEKKSESQDIDEQKPESESEQQFERFHNANDQEIEKLNSQNKKKNKKGSKKGSNKLGQQLAKFIQNHKIPVKPKDNSYEKVQPRSKPKQYIQTSLQALFQKGAQKKKPEITQKMQEQDNNKQSSQQQDSLEMHRKRMMMQNLNAGLNDDEALKIALMQSKKDIKPNQKNENKPKQAPKPIKQYTSLDNYAFENMNKVKKNLNPPIQEKKQPKQPKQPKQAKKQLAQSKPKQALKKKEEKKQKPKSKKGQKSENDEKKGVLSGLGIVITGQIQPYSKNQILQMLQQLGALTPHSITKKTTHLLQGNVVKNQFNRVTGQDVKTTSKSIQAAQKNIKIIPYEQLDDFFMQKTNKTLRELMDRNKPKKQFNPLEKFVQIKNTGKTAAKSQMQQEAPHSQTEQIIPLTEGNASLAWTQKYKPRCSEQIIGQNSQIKDLKQWLTVWQDIHIHGNKRDVKPNFNSFLPSGTINSNAALISGDAGLGKTTTARLIAAQFGYSVVQYNASDARNKKSVELISMGKNNMAFMGNKKQQMNKTLIIMDQVDGMSSGDRGGISAIIDMIKKTKVPIICICNDRQATKIRSLAGHCYDIKYHKPNKKMVADRLADIIKIQGGQSNPIALQRLVQLLQNDMRQCLNYVELLFKSGVRNFSTDIIQKRCSNTKDSGLTLNFFQATKTLLTRTMFMGMKISQKTELAFVDSDMVPLMVQQNYLSACPKKKMNRKQFHKFTKATQGFVKADLIDRTIMKSQSYCLMPNKMFLSCIYPCQMICQSLGFPKFTQWLGKFSAQRKNKRLIRQLKYSIGCVTPVTTYSVKHHFVAMLYQRICQQLRVSQPQTEKIVQFMFHYGLTPSILTQNLCSLQYGERQSIYKNIQTSKKTKLTKLYNKMHQTLKFKKQKSKVVAIEHPKYDPVLGQMQDENQQEQDQQEVQNQEQNSEIIVDKKAAKSKPKKKK